MSKSTARLAFERETNAERLASFGEQWATSQQAGKILQRSIYDVSPFLQHAVESRIASTRGATSARGCGRLWLRLDLERLHDIRQRCGLSIRQAIRVMAQLKTRPL